MSITLIADKKKLIILFIALILLAFVFEYAFLISKKFYHSDIEHTKLDLLNRASDIRSFTKTNINDQIYDLNIISQTAEIKDFIYHHKKHSNQPGFCLFKTIQETNMNDFLVVALLDTNGIPFHTHSSTDFNNDLIKNISELPEVKNMAKTHEPKIGRSFIDSNNELIINLVFPVFVKNRFSGAIFTSYSITRFCQKYFSSSKTQNFPIEITDRSGNYLFNSQPGFPDLGFPNEDKYTTNNKYTDEDIELNKQWIDHMRSYKTNTALVTYIDANNNTDQVILAHTPLDIGPNKFMISVYDDLDEATKSSYILARNFILILTFITLIFLIMWYFGWSWLKRIVKIKKESRLLSKINQSEDRYWNLFNSSPIPIFVMTPQGHITNGNKQFLAFTGIHELKDVYGKRPTDVIRFENEQKFKNLLHQVQNIKNKSTDASEVLYFYHSGGQLKLAEFSLSEIIMGEGSQLMCIAKDMTEKRLAENLSLRFGRILNNSNNEIYVVDGTTFRFMHATDGALANLGYNIEELRMLTPQDIAIFYKKSFHEIIAPLLAKTQDQLIFEVTQKRKDGSTYPAEVSLQISHEEQPPVLIAILRDLTREKKADETLAIEKSLSQDYLKLAEVMFVAVDKKGMITMINRKGLEILGYASDEVMNKNWVNLFIPDEVKSIVSGVLNELVNKKTELAENFESQIITKDGKHKLISWQHKCIKNNTNEVIGVLSSGMDITEAKKQEYDLINSQRQYATLIGNLQGIVYRCLNDSRWTMEFISQGLFPLAGYKPQEIIQNAELSFCDIIHPDDKTFVLSTIKAQLEKGESFRLEYRIIHKSGKVVWVTEFGQGILEDGSYQHLEGFITNITKIKESDAQLLKLTTAIEQSASSVVITDTTGIIEYVNPYFTKITGYTQEEAIGQKTSILKSGQMQPQLYEEMWKTISAGKTWHGEFHNKNKNGNLFWESAVIAAICDKNGKTTSYIAIKQDITKFKHSQQELIESQEELKQSEARYRSLIQNNNSIMLLFDPETGEITEANKAACTFYGKTEKELKETCIFDLNTLQKSEIRKHLAQLLSGEKSYFVFKHRAADNQVKDVELYTGEINHQGRKLYFSVIHDITEKLETQKELVTAKEKAIESDRLKSAFLANMSHEIRTPMNAILGFSQLLDDKDITHDEMDQYISIINRSSSQLLSLIDDILKISQIEAGIVSIVPEKVNLTKLLNEIYQFFSLTAKQKKIGFYLDLPIIRTEDIFLDASRFKQIQINLISNAIKFTHKGEVRFGYEVDNSMLKFHVTDTGIGIDPIHFKLIFDRFMQVPHQEKELYGGTGIGLSISQALVEKMGGSIWLESQVNKGTTFFFTIPLVHGTTHVSTAEIETFVTNAGESNLSNKNILITDDDDRNLSLLAHFLEPEKANLIFAGNGQEAIDIIVKSKNIDLVLMDIKMPVMNGLDATKIIKEKFPRIPVIIQTAYAMDNEKEAAMNAGGDAYVSKPVNRKLLLETISKFLK